MPLQPADSWISRHRIELGLSLRMTIAALLSFAAAHLFSLSQGYWAVLTAVIVMQASVGGSLKATLDRFVSTLGGAGWGVAVTLAVPHRDIVSTGVALTIALIPLALLVAFWPSYRVAPVTAVIVLLGRLGPGGAVAAAFDRVFEIGLGSVAALVVALLIVPARAHGALYRASGDALARMADLAATLLAGVDAPIEPAAVLAAHDRIRAAIERVAVSADEAARERHSYVTDWPDPAPLVRTLRRLSNDLVIIARALPAPLPRPVAERLSRPAAVLGAAIAARMTEIGAMLTKGAAPTGAAAPNAAFDAFDAALVTMRQDGVTHTLPADDVQRVFGLFFGIEQLRRNLDELAGRTHEIIRA